MQRITHPQQSPASTGRACPRVQKSCRQSGQAAPGRPPAPQRQQNDPLWGGISCASRGGPHQITRPQIGPSTDHAESAGNNPGMWGCDLQRCRGGGCEGREGGCGSTGVWRYQGGGATPPEGGRGWRRWCGRGRVVARLEVGWGGNVVQVVLYPSFPLVVNLLWVSSKRSE